jgi:hypothetical protein
MRVLSSRLLAGLCLTAASLTEACTLSRPEGAFNPVYPEAGVLDDFDEGDGDAPGDGDGPDVFEDAGMAEPTNDKFKGIVGTYLARFDEHSRTVSQLGPPVGAISSNSRTSRFFLLRIEEKNGMLVSTEQMCGQSNASTCEKNCETSTKLFSEAAALIPKSPKIVREITLNEKTGFIEAYSASTFLGYNPTEGDRALPTSIEDPRLWNKDSDGREGLYTELKITVEVLGAPSSVVCQVNMVQELKIAWNANVSTRTEGVFSLGGAKGQFSSGDTKSDILDAKANPADKREDCMGDGQTDGSTDVERGIVAFKKTELTKCPKVSEFETLIPPDAPP